MSSKRRELGAGTFSVPAPRPRPDEVAQDLVDRLYVQLSTVRDALDAQLSEARGVLNDLVRERKAVEKLARDHAEKIITDHVNACMAELDAHAVKTIKENAEACVASFKLLLDDFMGRSTRMRKERGPAPSLEEVLEAVEVLHRAQDAHRATGRDDLKGMFGG